jgi:putative membrane protein
MKQESESANPSSLDLAVERTRLAHERTLMAWVRTSASLIGFGFTIYKFFQYLREQNQLAQDRLFGPREFAMALVIIGLTALVLATLQHRTEMASLRKHFVSVPYSLATVVAGLVGLLGIITFGALILRK